MPMSHYSGFSNGVAIRGVPILNTYPENVFWVDSNNGSNGNDGTFNRPWGTVAYAVTNSKFTTSRGGVVMVKAGHAETISAAGTITMSKAGMSVVGLGVGDNRPVFTWSATAGTWAVTAANCSVKNCIFTNSVDSVVKAFNVSAAGFVMEGCEFVDSTSAIEFVTAVLTTAAADNLTVVRTRYRGQTGGDACVAPIQLVGCNEGIIDLDFYGKASTAVVNFITTLSTGIRITGQFYNSGTTDGTKNVVDTIGSSTWIADIMDGAAGLFWRGGSGTAAVLSGGQGALVPSADSTSNTYSRDVVGNKTDAGVQAVTTNVGLMAYVKGILDNISGAAGITTFPAAAAAANAVSIAEVLRYVSDVQSWKIVNKNFAATGSSLTTGLSPVTTFTVTGAVQARFFGVTGATPLASTLNNGTLALGISGSTTIYLGTTTMDGTNFPAGGVWIDTSPTLKSEAFVAANLVYHLISSVTVIMTVATNSSTAGVLDMYAEWKPISSGATVV